MHNVVPAAIAAGLIGLQLVQVLILWLHDWPRSRQ